MSSSYDALCLSHDPALSVCDPRRRDANDALAIAKRDHPTCDLLVARHSGGLIALGCPTDTAHPAAIHWIGAEWVTLLLAACESDAQPQLVSAISEVVRINSLWRPEWLRKLRHLLIEEDA